MGSYGGAGDLSMSCFSLSCGHFSKHDMDTHVLVLGWMAVGGGGYTKLNMPSFLSSGKSVAQAGVCNAMW